MDGKTETSLPDPKIDNILHELSRAVVDMKINIEMLHKSVLYDGKMLQNLQTQVFNLTNAMESSNNTILYKMDQLLQNQNTSLHRPVNNRSVGVFTTASIHDNIPTFLVYPDHFKTYDRSMTPRINENEIAVRSGSSSNPSKCNTASMTDSKIMICSSDSRSGQTYTTPSSEVITVAEEKVTQSHEIPPSSTAGGDHPSPVLTDTSTSRVQEILEPRNLMLPVNSATTSTVSSLGQTIYTSATLPQCQELREILYPPAAQCAVSTTPKSTPPLGACQHYARSKFMSALAPLESATRTTPKDSPDLTANRCDKRSEIVEIYSTTCVPEPIDVLDSNSSRGNSASTTKNVTSTILVPSAHESRRSCVASSVSQSKIGCTLFTAAATGNAEAVLHILETEPNTDVRQRDASDNTALHLAALGGHESVAMVLLGAGALVNVTGRRHRTPLHCAAAWGHNGVVRRLLVNIGANADADTDADADADVKVEATVDDKNNTKFVSHPQHQSVLCQEDKDGQTPIMLAAAAGHWSTVEMLLRAGSLVHGRSKNGQTILQLATKARQWSVVQAISKRRRLPKMKETSKIVPLLMAVEKGDGGAVRDLLLLEDYTDEMLEEAFALVKDAAVARTFSQQARRIVRGNAGLEVLWRGARFGDAELLEVILETGADVNARNGFRNTALHYAAYNGHAHCVKLLLQRGAMKNAQGNRGRTPLYDASEQGKDECVRTLLVAGAYAKLKSDEGKTPLEAAKTDIVRTMLIDYLDCPMSMV